VKKDMTLTRCSDGSARALAVVLVAQRGTISTRSARTKARCRAGGKAGGGRVRNIR